MARGDVKYKNERYKRDKSERMPSASVMRNDASKRMLENFVRMYNGKFKEEKMDFLFSLGGEICRDIVRVSSNRYGIEDLISFHNPKETTRLQKYIEKDFGISVWRDFVEYVINTGTKYNEQLEKEQEERNKVWRQQQQERMAKQVLVEAEQNESAMKVIDMVAGTISSDMSTAFTYKDKIGNDGDWIEDVVDTYISGTGFGYEIKKAVGTKLQVTVSLDLSNSMYFNRISKVAAAAFRDIAVSLKKLSSGEYNGNLFYSAFEFSMGRDGSYADRLSEIEISKQYPFGELSDYKPSRIVNFDNFEGPFTGQDTRLAPLLQTIEHWESENSDPGALKLDIIITDAVLEKANDIRESSAIQERRDGSLQTVMLNLMPEKEWINSTLPNRCYQYAANPENIGGLLRMLLAEFVSVNI